jgi:LuxR family transcriptional regulator, maltose regulon positive regulatory protein
MELASSYRNSPRRRCVSPPRTREHPIARQRLVEALESQRPRLAIVRAPPGFGKTTLLQQWHDHIVGRHESCCWLTLDEADNDVTCFVDDLTAAINPEVATDALPAGGAAELLHTLSREIGSCDKYLTLMLDQIDCIHTDETLTFLRALVQLSSERFTIVVAGRSTPMLGQAKLRLRGEVLEILQDDLRFQPQETVALITTRLGTRLDKTDIDRLHQHTDGWAAALQLACLSLRYRSDFNGFIDAVGAFEGELAEYLSEDVLAGQPPLIRQFLITVAPFNELSAALCDAVTERNDGAAVLTTIEHAGLFLKRVDNGQGVPWYRFHHLFAEFLRTELHRSVGSDRIKTIQLAGSRWYAANNMPVDAAQYALHAGDRIGALTLLDGLAMDYLAQGQVRTVLGWSAYLPGIDPRAFPNLLCACAWAEMFTGNIDKAKRLLEPFAETKDEADALSPFLRDSLATFELMAAAITGQFSTIRQKGPAALRNISRQDSYECSAIANLLSYAYFTDGDLSRAREMLRTAKDTWRSSDRSLNHIYSAVIDGLICLSELHLLEARAVFRDAFEQAKMKRGPMSLSGSLGASYYAESLYEMNLLEDAGRIVRGRLAAIVDGGFPDFAAALNIVAARLKAVSGDHPAAVAILLEAETDCAKRQLRRAVRVMRWERARLVALAGDHDGATQLAQQIEAEDGNWDGTGLSMSEMLVRDIAPLRIRLLSGATQGVAASLARLIAEAKTKRAARRRLLALTILYSVALAMEGHRVTAVNEMARALKLGLPHGFMRSFIDEGPIAHDLIRLAAPRLSDSSAIIHHNYAELLKALGGVVEGRAVPAHGWTDEARSQLTSRELEIIDIVQKGLSNKEIAACLSLKERTVKWHLQNAFAKLGVANRTEAVFLTRRVSA